MFVAPFLVVGGCVDGPLELPDVAQAPPAAPMVRRPGTTREPASSAERRPAESTAPSWAACADPVEPSEPPVALALEPSDQAFPNPERGFFSWPVRLADTDDFDGLRTTGVSLAFAAVSLAEFRDTSISADRLDEMQAAADRARAAGMKLILRFSYVEGAQEIGEVHEDAPLATILEHIAQLEPLFRLNEDVVAFVQAGFIGAWGEWHGSSHGLETPEARGLVLQALLAAVPESRFVQVRRPAYKGVIEGGLERIGHHNDCFLASDTDVGTYTAGRVDAEKAFLADDTLVVPIGGETCRVSSPRTDCPAALDELEALHWTYLNSLFHPGVVDAWKAQGCYDEIDRRLGYRLRAHGLSISPATTAGGRLDATVALRNDGWARPVFSRDLIVVVRHDESGTALGVVIDDGDPGLLQAGDQRTHPWSFRMPDDAPDGDWTFALWLPDPAESIRTRPEFAIRLANAGVWEAATGLNVLGGFHVAPRAAGATDCGQVGLVRLK